MSPLLEGDGGKHDVKPELHASLYSSNAVRSPRSLPKITVIEDDSEAGSPVRVPKDASMNVYMPSLEEPLNPPDSFILRVVQWLLFNQPVFPHGHAVTSESSYLLTRGGGNLLWLSDASYRAVHAAVGEAIEFAVEPLGVLNTAFIWFLMVVAILIAVIGSAANRDPMFLLALLVPLLLIICGSLYVARSRRNASLVMARCAYERERAMRMRERPPSGHEPDMVAHHVILSFLEDVLEFCKYGELPGSGVPHAWGWGNRAASMSPEAAAAHGLRGHPDCTVPAMIKTECYKCNDCGLWFGMHAFTRWCSVDGPLERLRCVSDYVHENIGVCIFKYDWQTDSALRMAAVAKAEFKLVTAPRFGKRSAAVVLAGMLPAALLLLCCAALVNTGNMFLYIPAIVTASVFFLVSFLLLWRRLPVWRTVDGLVEAANQRLKQGSKAMTEQDEITQITDLAVKALDFSLTAMNDRGEQQSCEYWPTTLHDHREEDYRVFEGLDAARMTPSEEQQTLHEQLSVRLQYAKRNQFKTKNNPPNMNTHTNALAFSTALSSPSDSPQHAARNVTHRRQQSATDSPAFGQQPHAAEPSLFDLPSSVSGAYQSGTQAAGSSGDPSLASTSKVEPPASVNAPAGLAAFMGDAVQQGRTPPVHVPLHPKYVSKLHGAHTHATARPHESDDDPEESTALLPGAGPVKLRGGAAQPRFAGGAPAEGLEQEASVLPNPLPPSTPVEDDIVSTSGTTFNTALDTPAQAFSSSCDTFKSPFDGDSTAKGSPRSSPLRGTVLSGALARIGGGNSNMSDHAVIDPTPLVQSSQYTNSGGPGTQSATLFPAAMRRPNDPEAQEEHSIELERKETSAEIAGGYSAGLENSESFMQSNSKSGRSKSGESSRKSSIPAPKPPAAPPIDFAGKPAVGAYAAAPFIVAPLADEQYASSHVTAPPPGDLSAGPASAATTGSLLQPGSHLVVGSSSGQVSAPEFPEPFSAASSHMTPAKIVQLLDLKDL